jgi:thioesterase domain-containing protein
MIPAAFVLLERFPLTPNGKVDRKALPEPDTSASQAYYVAPRTDMEHALCGLWQEVLGVEQVGITDDFFRLGGHSLLAAQMIARLRQMRNIEVPLRTLFVAPDIASLAASINDQAPASQFSNLIRMRAGSADPVRPMFLIHPGEGEIGYAKDLAPWLASGLTIYGLAATGFLDGETALESVPEMAAAYIKAIRHVQAHGPYRIAGWSAGGTIAYEMARQLIGVGERIEFLGLIDTSCDYSLLKQRMAGKFCGDADLDQANFLLMALPENLPESRVAELTTWARSGAVIPMLEHCRDLAIFPSGIDSTTLRRYLAVRIAILRALMAYNPQPLSIPISLFAATRNAPQDLALGWGALLGDWLRVAPVEGTHYTIMHPQNIQGLGLAISTALVEVSEA